MGLGRAGEIADGVRSGRQSAVSIIEAALAAAAGSGVALCAVTRVLRERAMARAARIDAQVLAGEDPGPLAGVPFAVKDLFDVAGLPTTAGAAMLEDAPSASRWRSHGWRLPERCWSPRVTWTRLPMGSRRSTRASARRAIRTNRFA